MTRNPQLQHDARQVVERASAIVKDFHDVGDAAKRIASDGVDALRDTANQYLDEGRARVRHLGDGVQWKVEQQPVKSLLIAAGIGFLLGAIWRRR